MILSRPCSSATRLPGPSGIGRRFALALAGCAKHDGERELNQLDAELVGNAATDPAVSSALEDQIMVDPSLAQQADGYRVRTMTDPGQSPLPPAETLALGASTPAITGLARAPAAKPATPCVGANCGTAPSTLGQLAALQTKQKRPRQPVCNPDLTYSFAWAAKLPPELPVYPQAQVDEAAGSDAPGCHARVVSFSTPASRQAVTDYYYSRAIRARFSAEHSIRNGDHILSGERGGDDYYLILDDRAGGGTAVDMIVSTAR